MIRNSNSSIPIKEALNRFGGFVRYYDTTEPLRELAALVSVDDCRDILACCGGGNQALTILGAASKVKSLYAVDINSAQLFVLAAKASFLKSKNVMPSFESLQKLYPGRIAAMKKNIRHFEQMHLCHIPSGKLIKPPASLFEKYTLVLDGEMFVLPKSGPTWQTDQLFLDRVRARLNQLRFAHMDIFDSSDYFKKGSLDLIYLSDIFWPQELDYFRLKIAKLAQLLRVGGRIISFSDPGDDFMGQGVSPTRLLIQQARELSLKVSKDKASRYLVLERIKKS